MVVSSSASARSAALYEKRGAREHCSGSPASLPAPARDIAGQLRTAALRGRGHLTKLGSCCNTGCAMFTGKPSGKRGPSIMTLPASLLIVDDDRELGQMLTEYLTGEGFQVTLLRDGAEALDRLTEQSHPFDLVILDVMLPSLSGFEVLRRLRHSLSVPVIMLTAHGADVDRIVGLELGADDYLSKPFNPRELVARVRAVLRRFSPRDADMPAHPVSVGPVRLDPATFEVTLSGESVRLTGTELRLLEVLMRAVGQVQSRESLTERVLGRRLTPYDRSIDTHVSNLRRKLGLGENGLPEIRSIRGAGYVLIASSGEARAESSRQ
jgi:DNA-binding response OmpR family regulator